MGGQGIRYTNEKWAVGRDGYWIVLRIKGEGGLVKKDGVFSLPHF